MTPLALSTCTIALARDSEKRLVRQGARKQTWVDIA